MITDNLVNYPQILDGFCYAGIFGARPLTGLSWYWNCLANMEDLRLMADSYRPRWWTVPKNFTDSANTNSANIEPGKTFFYEFQVVPGSWIWGLQFSVFDDDLEQLQFSVMIRQGTDLPFFDRVFAASGIYSGSQVDPFNTLKPSLRFLSQPRLIIPPAQIHVEVSNDADPADSDNAVSCQLLILVAEPKVCL